MKSFFGGLPWWKLTPRFDDANWFEPENSAWYSLATSDADLYVLYFYNWQTTATGVLRHMRPVTYTAKWFNTKTGVYTDLGEFRPENDTRGAGCRWKIPEKPTASDWVLLARALPSY
jgi:hypothetical protein